MKILFVCWANVGRSQMAAAFYNHLTGTHDADAAGTEVSMPGETLGDRQRRRGGTYVVDEMKDIGIDISNRAQTQLIEEMLDNYDRVICMADPDHSPKWLRDHPKFEYWEVTDPGGKGREETRITRDIIKKKVEQLIQHLQHRKTKHPVEPIREI